MSWAREKAKDVKLKFKSSWKWAVGGNSCEVCGRSLKLNNPGQVVRYHKECRALRHNKRLNK